MCALLRALPMRAARAVAAAFGAVAWVVLRGWRGRVERHLARAMPDVSAAERGRLAREVFAHAAQLVPEAVKGSELDAAALERVVTSTGEEHVAAARAASAGGGVIFVLPHLGNWEMVARFYTAARGWDVTAIARGRDDSVLEALITRVRGLNGLKVQRRGESLRGIVRTLREGGDVAALPDQAIRGCTVPVTFFGGAALAHPGVAQLALLAGVPMVPTSFTRRRARAGEASWAGWRYEGRFEAAILPRDEAGARRTTEELTVAVAEAMEELIARHPSQWMWFHDRWRMQRERPTRG